MTEDGTAACVAQGGTARDQPCSFDATTRLDTCSAGTACSNATLPTGMAVCRKLCGGDGDCGPGQRCHPISSWGQCLPTCVAFGTQCPGGMTCGGLTADTEHTDAGAALFLTCRALGTGKTGDGCTRSSDCGADAICATRMGMAFCTPLCDGSHPCTAPAQCAPVDGIAVCQ